MHNPHELMSEGIRNEKSGDEQLAQTQSYVRGGTLDPSDRGSGNICQLFVSSFIETTVEFVCLSGLRDEREGNLLGIAEESLAIKSTLQPVELCPHFPHLISACDTSRP
jgi:hypothetical protein